MGAGIRPSFSLFLAPLFLFSLRKVSRKLAAAGIASLLLALLAWFIPMVEASGGLRRYMASFLALWRVAGGKETVFNSSPLTSLARFLAVVLAWLVTGHVRSSRRTTSVDAGARVTGQQRGLELVAKTRERGVAQQGQTRSCLAPAAKACEPPI